jgi:type II secretory pathway pseudopilin PulG
MKHKHLANKAIHEKGLSLIEVTIIIVAVGILASLAMQSMTALIKDARVAETEKEMNMLAKAIAGDPSVMAVAGGVRSDFGYVGDIGAFPANLQALATNPGYDTWNGPYLPPDFNRETNDYTKDAWGVDYSYSGGVTITSTGSGANIVKRFAESAADLLSNEIAGIIRDINDSLATADDTADLDVVVIYPDGTGGIDTATFTPSDTGRFSVGPVPIGRHPLLVIYTPGADTLTRYVTVVPRQSSEHIFRYNFDTDYFSDAGPGYAGLTLKADSDTAFGTPGACNFIKFWIENTTADPIQISSITLEYTKIAYYAALDYEGDSDYEFQNPSTRNESGDVVTFGTPETVPAGSYEIIIVETFKDTKIGSGGAASMENETVTVSFSDGSSFDVTFDYCE